MRPYTYIEEAAINRLIPQAVRHANKVTGTVTKSGASSWAFARQWNGVFFSKMDELKAANEAVVPRLYVVR